MIRRILRYITVLTRRVARDFHRDHCLIRASGLAFASLLALVPLSALLFSLFSALGSFSDLLDSIQAFLIRQLIPTRQEELMVYIRHFVNNTQALGVIGLLFFLLTSVFLLNAIQNTFDAVWGCRIRKRSLRKLATYVSILIVGSFIVSIALHLTGMIRSLIAGSAVEEIGRSLSFLFGVFPSIFIFLALLLMIRFIPTERVSGTSALIGALLGTILWEAARTVFLFWANSVIRLSVVYGSLATIPIFLIWLYVAWTIVLLSLEVTYAHQHRHKIWMARSPEEMSPAERLMFGLEIYLYIAGRFYRGEPAPTLAEVAGHFSASFSEITFFTERFKGQRLLLSEGRENAALVPARSLDKITLREIFAGLFGSPPSAPWQSEEALALFRTVTRSGAESIDRLTLRGFFQSRREGQGPLIQPPGERTAEEGSKGSAEEGVEEGVKAGAGRGALEGAEAVAHGMGAHGMGARGLVGKAAQLWARLKPQGLLRRWFKER